MAHNRWLIDELYDVSGSMTRTSRFESALALHTNDEMDCRRMYDAGEAHSAKSATSDRTGSHNIMTMRGSPVEGEFVSVVTDYIDAWPGTVGSTTDERRACISHRLPRTDEPFIDGGDATATLIDRAGDGDSRAFETLTSRFGRRLLGMVRRRLGHRVRQHVESRDIVQEVFAEVVLRFPTCTFSRRGQFVSWLKKIMCNKIHDQVREAARERHAFAAADGAGWTTRASPSDTPTQTLIRRESLRRLEAALGMLSERHATIIRLRDIEGLDYESVARQMGLQSLAATRMLRRRAWVALTKELQGWMDERSEGRNAAAG
ncbi:MAG: RNA polymerase sigma factor [Planctomycetes bacterium]|nr:RNA polymerase sigma factor [Planctomycetota bacterium]MBI3844919.1 RNA polymerase sigma factor [Planctomycetota bacterium]